MPSEPVCQVARSWVEVGSFHMRLVVKFIIFTASVRNILDEPSYVNRQRNIVPFSLNVYTQSVSPTACYHFPPTEGIYGNIMPPAKKISTYVKVK
jgi:hypothetical protein